MRRVRPVAREWENIVTTGITLPASSLTWVDQSTAIYPSSVTGLVQCGDGLGN